jgi:hypothetical protein
MSRLDCETPLTDFESVYFVRIYVPELGFGEDVDEMVQFCLEHDEALCTGYIGTRIDQRDWIFFSFQDGENAKAFAARFGGLMFEPAMGDFHFP